MMNAATIISAAQDKIAAAGGAHIGDLTSWNSEGVDVPRDRLVEIFAAEELGACVPGISPMTALSRAAREVPFDKAAGSLRVLPFARPNSDTPTAFGIYEVTAAGEKGDVLVCGARVRVILATSSIVALPPEDGTPVEACMRHAEAIAELANHIFTHAQTRDVSTGMVRVLQALSAVPLRAHGGFYLIPPSRCATWRRLTAGLKTVGIEPILIEMHDSPANVGEAAKAAKGALEKDVATLLADLDKAAQPEGMGERAISNRMAECRAISARAELYRAVLQGVVDDIATKCEQARTRFATILGGGSEDDALFTVPLRAEDAESDRHAA